MSASELSGGVTLATQAHTYHNFDALVADRIERGTSPPDSDIYRELQNGRLWFNRRVASYLLDRALGGDTPRLAQGLEVIEDRNPLMALNVRFIALRALENTTTPIPESGNITEHRFSEREEAHRSITYELLVGGIASQLVKDLRRRDQDRILGVHDYTQFFETTDKGSPFSLQTQTEIAKAIAATHLLPIDVKRHVQPYMEALQNREHTIEEGGVSAGEQSGGVGVIDAEGFAQRRLDIEQALKDLRPWLSPEEAEGIRLGIFNEDLSLAMHGRLCAMFNSGEVTNLVLLRDVMAEQDLLGDQDANDANMMHDQAVVTNVAELMATRRFDQAIHFISQHPAYTPAAREHLFHQLDTALNENGGKITSPSSKKVEIEMSRDEVEASFKETVRGVEFSDPIAIFIRSMSEAETAAEGEKKFEEFGDRSPAVVHAYNQAVAQKVSACISSRDFKAAQNWFGVRVRFDNEPEFDVLNDIIIDQHVGTTADKLMAAVKNTKLDINVIIQKLEELLKWYADAHLESDLGKGFRDKRIAWLTGRVDLLKMGFMDIPDAM